MSKVADRTFGVELEFNFQNSPDYDLRRDGLGGARSLLSQNGFSDWLRHIHGDGSGIEIPSPVLQGKDGLAELAAVLSLLNEYGGECTEDDGTHVHHGAEEFKHDKELVIRLLKSWKENQPYIFSMVDDYRVSGEGYLWCKPWSDAAIKQYEESDTRVTYWDRYYSLNVNPLGRTHPTLEIRLHEGTLEYDKIAAWIKFGQYFIASCLNRKHPIKACGDADTLLKRVRVPKSAAEKLAEAKRAAAVAVDSTTFRDEDGYEISDDDYDPWDW